MNIIKRKFKEAFELCQSITKQGLIIYKMAGKDVVETVLIKSGTGLCYAAKMFTEDPDNKKIFQKISKEIGVLGYTYGLVDKDTKALLYESNGSHQFSKEDRPKWEEALVKLLDEQIEFSEINVYICPKDKIAPNDEIPFELEILNGLILNHSFWDRIEFEKAEVATA